MNRHAPSVLCAAVLLLSAAAAQAQYRNHVFSLGLGYEALLSDLAHLDTGGAPMLGGSYRFKMLDDHWWFDVGVMVGFRGLNDPFGADALGTLLDVRPNFGLRYYFMTNKIRPYLQFGGALHTLFWFKSPAEDVANGYLPHPTFGTLYAQPGLELVFMRNTALQLYVDVHYLLFWNAPDGLALFPCAQIAWYM